MTRAYVKRLLSLLTVLLAMSVLCACGQDEVNMDTYHYDGYQNLQWGSVPERAIYQLGLSKRQVDRLEKSHTEGMPEGTFGYEITRTTKLFGLYVEAEMYFAENLYGMEQYTGVYGMKITFLENPEYYTRPAGAEPDDDSYYRLDPQKVIAEYDKRGLYNRSKEYGTYEDERGSWQTVSWSCDATLTDLPAAADTDAINAAIEAVGEVLGDGAAEALKTAPLSKFTLYYDNDQDEDPYMYFDGFPASILYNLS